MTEDSQKDPVLICGMHRSGTSLVAQLLNACGLYLGTEYALMQAHPEDNPNGYWEYLNAVQFADNLLSKISCSWDNPNNLFSDNWLMDINYEKEKQRAIEIFNPLINSEKAWGWKDPRATILLPFWKKVFPNLKIILCLRNPLEVAFSLSKRNGSSHVDFKKALVLWHDYHEILKSTIKGTEYLVTHYETLFYEPNKEIRRICNFSNLSLTDETIEKAKINIKSDLYRGVAIDKLFNEFDETPAGLIDIYNYFSNMAGPVFEKMTKDQDYAKSHNNLAFKKLFTTAHNKLDQYNHLLQSEKRESNSKDQTIQSLNAQLAKSRNEVLYYALSKSWRITRPLRKIMNLFRGKKND